MKTRFIADYVDEILLTEVKRNDMALLKQCGYKKQEGKYPVTFHFGDGIAYVKNGCSLVLSYPTLSEVEASEKMQKEIVRYTGRTDITQFDVALKYGKIGAYKYVLNYNKWVNYSKRVKGNKGNGEYVEIYAIQTETKDGRLKFEFDVFEEDFMEILEKEYYKTIDGAYVLRDDLSRGEIEKLRAEKGILWTESLGQHVNVEDVWIKAKEEKKDFYSEIKALHNKVVQEIKNLMQKHKVDEVDLAGSSADHAFIIGVPDFDWDCDYMEAEVLKVYLQDEQVVLDINWDIDSEEVAEKNEDGDIGDAYTNVTANDFKKVIPCAGIIGVYESVWQVLEENK